MICSRPSPFSRCSLPIHAASICAVPFTAWRGDPAVVGRRLLSRRTSADATRALSLGSEPRAIVTRTCRASASRGAGRALRSWRCEVALAAGRRRRATRTCPALVPTLRPSPQWGRRPPSQLTPTNPIGYHAGRTDLGCRMVADGLSRGLAEGSWNTISLQISGGPQGSRTPDLRRGTAPSARQRTDPALGRPTSVAAPSTRGGAAHRRRRGARSRPALK